MTTAQMPMRFSAVQALIDDMKPEERTACFEAQRHRYCHGCGRIEQEGAPRCQCENDE